jgi:predicted RNase H-like HicB family nuclease
MSLDDYKVLLYRNEPEGWVAEIPSIEGCYALMSTREEALAELGQVFEMIAAEYREKGASLPVDTTEIVDAQRSCGRVSPGRYKPGIRASAADRWSPALAHQDGRAVTIPVHGGRGNRAAL